MIYDAYVSYEFMKAMQEEKEKSRSKKEETNLVSAIFCGSHILLICTFQYFLAWLGATLRYFCCFQVTSNYLILYPVYLSQDDLNP